MSAYRRYEIRTSPAPNHKSHPSRFKVNVKRAGLAKLLLKEFIEYRGNQDVILSRPCVYGVFSGPVGGFKPRHKLCVGCLRCTVQHPDIVEVSPNEKRALLGDSFYSPDQVDTILYEASTGSVPVKGAGYRGRFGGEGWDSMWTDMSEIVRPTRDGIHGREFISTLVDIGPKPAWLSFDENGRVEGSSHKVLNLPIPILYNRLPQSIETLQNYESVVGAAREVETLAILPLQFARTRRYLEDASALLVEADEVPEYGRLMLESRLALLDGWDADAYKLLEQSARSPLTGVSIPFGVDLGPMLDAGVSVFHLRANYHGITPDGFVMDAIRSLHDGLVKRGVREQITLIGSGGIGAAEHVPKAIIAGLDAVALDIPIALAWHGQMIGEADDQHNSEIKLETPTRSWAEQRLINLTASWRDQLLEILGAMGLREVRRLRGEIGRAMFQDSLEREAFADIARRKA